MIQRPKLLLFVAQLLINRGILLMILPLWASLVVAIGGNGDMTAEGCSGGCAKSVDQTCVSSFWNPCSGNECSCPEKITIDGYCPCGYHPYGQ